MFPKPIEPLKKQVHDPFRQHPLDPKRTKNMAP